MYVKCIIFMNTHTTLNNLFSATTAESILGQDK